MNRNVSGAACGRRDPPARPVCFQVQPRGSCGCRATLDSGAACEPPEVVLGESTGELKQGWREVLGRPSAFVLPLTKGGSLTAGPWAGEPTPKEVLVCAPMHLRVCPVPLAHDDACCSGSRSPVGSSSLPSPPLSKGRLCTPSAGVPERGGDRTGRSGSRRWSELKALVRSKSRVGRADVWAGGCCTEDGSEVGGSLDPGTCPSWRFSPGHGLNLVDSASSHTLVSKIKPCMSKYKRFIL